MADFFTHFSCVLDVGTPDNAARALKLYQAFMEDAAREEVPPDGFLLSIEPEHGATAARPRVEPDQHRREQRPRVRFAGRRWREPRLHAAIIIYTPVLCSGRVVGLTTGRRATSAQYG